MTIFKFNKSESNTALELLTRDGRGVQNASSARNGASVIATDFSSLPSSLELIAELQQNAIFVSNCFNKDRVMYSQAIQAVHTVEATNTKYSKMFKE